MPMFFLYDLVVVAAGALLKVAALFSRKLKLFVEGRRDVFDRLQRSITPEDRTFWFHAASLGEYEQGLPVMERMKSEFPNHKIVLTFFSPSGYEVRKNNKVADITVYLPLDTARNAKKFVSIVKPEMAFFIKYEFWPNYLRALKSENIPSFLISGIFRKDQLFFKWYGGFYRKSLKMMDYFFVQNSASKELLASINITNVAISGDTRFDRVASILEKDNSIDFIEKFIDAKLTVVVGSSWPKDETLLVEYINSASDDIKFIIAPHNIKPEQIKHLQNALRKPVVLFSEKEGRHLETFNIFIIDIIGILTKIYSYADIAYVGGGFGNPGVHNLLEPATFGVPIIIGPNYSHFAEATALVHNGGAISVKDQNSLNEAFDMLISSDDIRHEKGHICATFVQMNRRATDIIVKHLTAAGRA